MRFTILLLLLMGGTSLLAQCDKGDAMAVTALSAYLDNDVKQWDQVVNTTEVTEGNTTAHLEKAALLFGAANAAYAKGDEDKIEVYLDEMEALLKSVLKADKENAAANGLYSAYLGMLIAKAPMKGMLYGRKAGRMARQGPSFDPNNPIAHYCHGSNLFYTPTTWGGDPEGAVTALEKAIAAFPPTADGCDWFYLQTHALLGQAQVKTGDKDAARKTYQKALALQPDFGWVKYVLMPALDKTGR
ncbi:MAG: tetratricopeptide repeat protein [Bacteroidota bacterium]